MVVNTQYTEAVVRQETASAAIAVSQLLGDASTYLRTRHDVDCDRDNGSEGYNAEVGRAAVLNGVDPYILTGTAADDRLCRAQWSSLRSVFSVAPEGTGVGAASYDGDLVREWHIGSPESGYDVGFILNFDAAAVFGSQATPGGVVDTASFSDASTFPTCPNAGATAPNNVVHLGIGIAVPSQRVCEGLLTDIVNARDVTAVGCLEVTGRPAGTATYNLDGDSVVAICMNRS